MMRMTKSMKIDLGMVDEYLLNHFPPPSSPGSVALTELVCGRCLLSGSCNTAADHLLFLVWLCYLLGRCTPATQSALSVLGTGERVADLSACSSLL